MISSALVVAGCSPTPPDLAKQTSAPIAYQLDGGGVQLSGAAMRIDFGRTDHSAIPAMSKLVGSAPISQQACGDVLEVSWAGDVRLYFVGGDFRGWSNTERSAGATCGT